jgi:hypothetical protein
MLRDKFRKLTGHSYILSTPKQSHKLRLINDIQKPTSYNQQLTTNNQPPTTFTFLNQPHTFKKNIDWNFNNYGKLWAYNLNYFDYLLQKDIAKEQGLRLIYAFINQIEDNRQGLEPYPLSLRGMNWIKFLSQHTIEDAKIDASLYAQYQILLDNIEYHLLGNHLMENGCSLLFGAFYFKDEALLKAAKTILKEQLDEQILADGGHFERSTMYHLIILERLMDCYNLIANNSLPFQLPKLKEKLQKKVELMLGWMEQLTVGSTSPRLRGAGSGQEAEGPELPLLNDAAPGISAPVDELIDYAGRLGLRAKKVKLSESGYRTFKNTHFELICDVGNIGPDYIPGHAHCDTLSFVLYCKGLPAITDPGISTYENNKQRRLERSTAFHNTVEFDGKEQSEIWGAFRVGRRAKIHDVCEQKDENGAFFLSACHDGYQKWGVKHKRGWMIENDGKRIIIKDQLIGNEEKQGILNLHFHKHWTGKIAYKNGEIILANLTISFENASSVKLTEHNASNGYNSYIPMMKAKIIFADNLTTFIDFR